MHFEGYDELPDEETVIEEALGENSRARDLRLMRAALTQRLNMIRKEQRVDPEHPQPELQPKIAELKRQIAALRQEEAIASFVEGSVRVTLHRRSVEDTI